MATFFVHMTYGLLQSAHIFLFHFFPEALPKARRPQKRRNNMRLGLIILFIALAAVQYSTGIELHGSVRGDLDGVSSVIPGHQLVMRKLMGKGGMMSKSGKGGKSKGKGSKAKGKGSKAKGKGSKAKGKGKGKGSKAKGKGKGKGKGSKAKGKGSKAKAHPVHSKHISCQIKSIAFFVH